MTLNEQAELKDWLLRLLEEREKRWLVQFTAQEKAVIAALTAAERAITKSETAAEKRFDSVNEFRSQLADQAATFMPRGESEIRFAAVVKDLTELRSFKDTTSGGSAGVAAAWGYVAGVIGLVCLVVGAVISVIR